MVLSLTGAEGGAGGGGSECRDDYKGLYKGSNRDPLTHCHSSSS